MSPIKLLAQFFHLERKDFLRSPSFDTSLVILILMGLGALYFAVVFVGLGIGIYFIAEDVAPQNPFGWINQGIWVFWLADLIFRYMGQKMPITKIKPLLSMPISKSNIVVFSMLKSVISPFNWLYLFLWIPLYIVLLQQDLDPVGVTTWILGVSVLFLANNFLNLWANNSQWVFATAMGALIAAAAGKYFELFDLKALSGGLFEALYQTPITLLGALAWLAFLVWGSYRFFLAGMFLDDRFSVKTEVARTAKMAWLDTMGRMGIFLKNDLRLITRNKRAKMAVLSGIFFLFYGLLFFTNALEVYQGAYWKVFAGIFVTGGFLFSFGGFVPSWDSSYYPLMMTQRITYADYLKAKWWLIVWATLASTVLASFYALMGWEVYLAVLAGAAYNVGINAHLVLLGGAFVKTPIDLTSAKKAFGDKQAVNLKTMLIALPKIALPMGIYALGQWIWDAQGGYLLLIGLSMLGFGLRNPVLRWIERIYKKEKYDTIQAYKPKS
jgi:hypothetical protein